MINPSFNLNLLKQRYSNIVAYIQYLRKSGYMHSKNISPFWQDILDKRKNFPEFNEMITMRRNSTYPMADGNAFGDPWKRTEQEHTQAAHDVIIRSVPKDYFLKFHESYFGDPLVFEFDGNMLSAGGIINALTSYRIIQWLKKYKLISKPLRILEIGGGYGQVAYQLMQQLSIKSYTFIDLPENLFLCAFYMQANFPAMKVTYLTAKTVKQDNGFIFLTPDFLNNINQKYDLVINSYSLQEMNMESVKKYFSLIEKHLGSDGVFYSLNAHGKAGVIKPSDYPIQNFKLEGLSPIRTIPHHYMFATNPYEIILKKTKNNIREKDHYSSKIFDSLGFLYQLGLSTSIEKLSFHYVHNSLSQKEINWLESVYEWVTRKEYGEKNKYRTQLKVFPTYSQIQTYLMALLQYAGGDLQNAKKNMESVVHTLSEEYVQLYGYLVLASIYKLLHHESFSLFYLSKFQKKAPHLGKEASYLIDNCDTLADNIAAKIYLIRQKSQHFWNSFLR